MTSLLVNNSKIEEISQVQEPSQRGGDGYLETVDNVSFKAKTTIPNWLSATCDKGKGYFITAECENGHRFAKELVCNKDWCLICGKDGSIAHNRKIERWLGKAQQMESIGYFVFTIPLELRANFRTKEALKRFGYKVQEMMKAHGYTRGLRRWHVFGEKSTRFNPHLNILVDAGYIPPDQLETIKKAYSVLLGVDMADINYHYREEPGKKYHTLKYVTRATFLDSNWNEELAMELRNFRNMVSWGRGLWADLKKHPEAAVWSMADLQGEAKVEVEGLDIQAIEALVEKRCPECGKPLKWSDALPIGLLAMVEKRSLGAGYWELPPVRPPPELPAAVRKRLYRLELIHRAEVQVAAERVERERAVEAEYQVVLWQDLTNLLQVE